jgi:hypothetical protein
VTPRDAPYRRRQADRSTRRRASIAQPLEHRPVTAERPRRFRIDPDRSSRAIAWALAIAGSAASKPSTNARAERTVSRIVSLLSQRRRNRSTLDAENPAQMLHDLIVTEGSRDDVAILTIKAV